MSNSQKLAVKLGLLAFLIGAAGQTVYSQSLVVQLSMLVAVVIGLGLMSLHLKYVLLSNLKAIYKAPLMFVILCSTIFGGYILSIIVWAKGYSNVAELFV